ncbi:MAG TPA: hypothetical protein VEX38_05800 [Fimbriimonadaceae bacterium]|nr:hypothetical protein [Fimbriimonadaceae bacterium]
MSTRSSFLVLLCGAAVLAAYTLVVWSSVPVALPTRWSGAGEAVGYSLKGQFVLFTFGAISAIATLIAFPWRRLAPDRQYVANTILLYVSGFLASMHVLFLETARRESGDPSQWMVGGIMLTVALLANHLGRFRLAEPRRDAERRWIATHRFGARVLVAAALLGFVVNAFGMIDFALALLLFGVVATVLYDRFLTVKSAEGGVA